MTQIMLAARTIGFDFRSSVLSSMMASVYAPKKIDIDAMPTQFSVRSILVPKSSARHMPGAKIEIKQIR